MKVTFLLVVFCFYIDFSKGDNVTDDNSVINNWTKSYFDMVSPSSKQPIQKTLSGMGNFFYLIFYLNFLKF